MKKFLAGILVTLIAIGYIYFCFHSVTDTDTPKTTTADTVIVSNPISLVTEIKSLCQLETASMEISQTFTASRNNQRIFGILGEELSFFADGKVIAGFDLSQISQNDIEVLNENTVKIYLPKAEIFNIIINNQTSYVFSRTKGILAKYDSQLETEIRAYAQEEFEKTALDSTLLFEATLNGTDYLQNFIQQTSDYQIIVFSIKA